MDMTKVLPDECMSLIISFTSPRDACRMALVSRALRSVADSDAVWLSFRLEKENGKKCYMLGARALSIQWADSPDYWSWIPLPESRFSEVPKLKNVWRLDVKGRIELKTLSYRTNYSAYLVFKIVRDRYGFRHTPVEFRVIINEGTASGKVRSVILDPPPNVPQQAKERGDSWLEIEMGEFFNECGDDTRVEFYLRGVHDNQPKRGLIIEGIELRPKDNR
ncbi:F-box domain - like 10 [Theobroma cacao]|nr:F-box domain - like 10 [Theobroma cacao]